MAFFCQVKKCTKLNGGCIFYVSINLDSSLLDNWGNEEGDYINKSPPTVVGGLNFLVVQDRIIRKIQNEFTCGGRRKTDRMT